MKWSLFQLILVCSDWSQFDWANNSWWFLSRPAKFLSIIRLKVWHLCDGCISFFSFVYKLITKSLEFCYHLHNFDVALYRLFVAKGHVLKINAELVWWVWCYFSIRLIRILYRKKVAILTFFLRTVSIKNCDRSLILIRTYQIGLHKLFLCSQT